MGSDVEDERQLVERAQAGDQDAFQELVVRYQRKVYSICYGMLKNQQDSMDVSQDVFIKVFRYLEKFNHNSSFYTWLYRITVNKCIDFIRKRNRRSEVDYNDAVGREDDVDSDEQIMSSTLGLRPDRVYARKELRDNMLEALDTLSEKHRTILILREVEGLAYEEIADVLGISKGTVMSRLYHARRYFQEAIKEYLGETLVVK